MFGGDTLYELRVALQVAETEREGVSIIITVCCYYYCMLFVFKYA